jgi:hypothetical protein
MAGGRRKCELLLLWVDNLEALVDRWAASGVGSRELFLHLRMVRKAIGGHLVGAFPEPTAASLKFGELISSYNRIIL